MPIQSWDSNLDLAALFLHPIHLLGKGEGSDFFFKGGFG